jgi:AraC-like DNA-binding protein
MEKTLHLLISYTMLVLTLFLFHKGRKHHRSLFLALYASVEVITNAMNSLTIIGGWEFFDRFPFTHFIYKPLYCLWVPLFYFYFRLSFNENFKFKRKHLAHFVPFALFVLLFLSITFIKGNRYIWQNLYKWDSFISWTAFSVDITVKLQYVLYCFLMIRILLSAVKKIRLGEIVYMSVDINWIRFIVYGYTFACFSGILVMVSMFVGYPYAWVVNIVSMSYFFLFFFTIFFNTITQKSFVDIQKTKNQNLSDEELIGIADNIERKIISEKLFLEPEMSLQKIALSLNMKERVISNAINTIRKKNFNDYMNAIRIDHACKLLLNDLDKPVFEVMYESGFNTKGAFNLAFKKNTGKTPTQYRAEREY